MTINFTRGHVSPLAMLMCNFSLAKPRVDNADKLSLTIRSVNKSSSIISRRNIEKVTYLHESLFVQAEHCVYVLYRNHTVYSSLENLVNRVQVCNGSILAVSKKECCSEFQEIILL